MKNKIKYLTRTELNKIINNLGLEKQEKNCFNQKIQYEFYKKEIEKDNTRQITTLDNEMNFDLEHDNKIYFLVNDFFDYNKIKVNKKGIAQPYQKTTITQIEIINEN